MFVITGRGSQHDNSQTAAVSLMKFCLNMYLDNLSVWTEPSTRRISSRAMRPGVGEEPDPWPAHPATGATLKVAAAWRAVLALRRCCITLGGEASRRTEGETSSAQGRPLTTSRNLLNIKVIGQKSRSRVFLFFFCVCAWYCLNQLSWIHEMSFARWRHFTTARGSDWGYPRAVLSLEQGLAILFNRCSWLKETTWLSRMQRNRTNSKSV